MNDPSNMQARRSFLARAGLGLCATAINPGNALIKLAQVSSSGFPELNQLISSAFQTSAMLHNSSGTDTRELYSSLENIFCNIKSWFKQPGNFQKILLHTLDQQIEFAQVMNAKCPKQEYLDYIERKLRDKGKVLAGTCSDRKLLSLANENLAEGFFNISDPDDNQSIIPQFIFKGLLRPEGKTLAANSTRNFLNFQRRYEGEELARLRRVENHINRTKKTKSQIKARAEKRRQMEESKRHDAERKAALRRLAGQIATIGQKNSRLEVEKEIPTRSSIEGNTHLSF